MTRIALLEALKAETLTAIKDLVLPTAPDKGGGKATFRTPEVYLMRLPDGTSAQKKTPYILHQLLTGKDQQQENELPLSTAVVRTIFAVYCDNEQEGGLMLLNMMERLRIRLLRNRTAGGQFTLDLKAGLECMAYPDDTAPFYAGEMVSNWKLPAIEMEVDFTQW